MPTDFFERQAKARRNTSLLIFLFVAAVVGITGTVFFVTYFAVQNTPLVKEPYQFAGAPQEPLPFPWEVPLAAGAGTLALIGGGSLYKVSALRAGGGTSVAETLGGKRLYPDSAGAAERRLLNVVEEMAIASGTPAPPVYLMDEPAINAFAAGFSPSDAVIGVTRGCVESLSREELQGVIAHEFSHILNGDMRMSIRLIGILHGILLLGLVGQGILRFFFWSGGTSSRSRNSDGDGKGGALIIALLAASVALIVIGSIGSLFGGLIKAAVSRQREYLADASAVQFTRNPGGIAGALKRIGAAAYGGRLRHPRAGEASHMFFAQGVWEGFTSLMATHPPLPKRILAIEPNWNGEWPEPVAAGRDDAGLGQRQQAAGAAGFAGASATAAGDASVRPTLPRAGVAGSDAIPLAVVDNAVDQVGEPTDDHRDYARQLIASIDPTVLAAAREPYGARAVVYALLLDNELEVRQHQMAALDRLATPDVAELTRRLVPAIVSADPRTRLPLVDLCLPALRAMIPAQYKQFAECLRALVAADQKLSLFEWTLARVLMRHLQPQFERVRSPSTKHRSLAAVADECGTLLSILAHAAGAQQHADAAFAQASARLEGVSITLAPRGDCSLTSLDRALNELAATPARERGRLIDACAEAICADGKVNVQEAELLRGVADLLDCPMPPLLAGQAV
ncbi:MAG: M48 family metallopeptidase [Planctomycetota bacterium]